MKIHTQKKQEFIDGNYVVFADYKTAVRLLARAIPHNLKTVNGSGISEWIYRLRCRESSKATFLINFDKRIIGMDCARHTPLVKNEYWAFDAPKIVNEQTMIEIMEAL